MLNEVLVQNSGEVGGTGGNGNFNSPDDVPEGVIAFFPDDGGNSVDISNGTNNKFENQGELQVVLGTSDGPIVTNPIDPSESEVKSQAYKAPQAQVDTLTPTTLSSDKKGIGFKITAQNMNDNEPLHRKTYDTTILSSDSATDIVDKIVNTFQDAPESAVNYPEGAKKVYVGSDAVTEITPSSGAASGQAVVTIDGTDYDITWDTDKTTTVSAFLAAHKNTIWDVHGVRAVENGSNNLELWYVNTSLDNADVSTSDGASTALAQSETQAKTKVRLEAKEVGDFFTTSFVGDWSPTVSTSKRFQEGTGSFEQVKEYEDDVKGFFGRYTEDDGILGRQDPLPNRAAKGNTYDLITLRSPNDIDRSINKQANPQDIVLALETSVDKTHVNSFFENLGVSL